MTRNQLLSNVWVRMLIFAWMIVFPIVFIALPAAEIFLGSSDKSWTPVWGLIVWMLGPLAANILMKWLGLGADEKKNETGSSGQA